MITLELVTYIKSQHAQGIPQDQMVVALKANGWQQSDIDEAIVSAFPEMAHPMPIALNSIPVQQSVAPITISPVVQPEVIAPAQSILVQPTPIQVAPVIQSQPVQIIESPASAPLQGVSVNPVATRSKKTFIVGAFVILTLLIAGGGAYGYFAGYFAPSLDTVSSQAFAAMYSAKSASFDVTTNITLPKMDSTESASLSFLGGIPDKIVITTKGGYDISDANNKKIRSTIFVDAGSTSLGAEIRRVNGEFYGQLTKAPTIAMMPMLSSLQNQWVAFSGDSKSEDMPETAFSTIPGIDADIWNNLTQEQKDKLFEITKNAHFITITTKDGSEDINGKSTYHFHFALDNEGIATYLKNIESYLREIGKNDSRLSSVDIASQAEDLNSIQNFVGEAWIGKKDKLLYKTDISFSFIDSVTKKEQGALKLVAVFDNWNAPIVVEAPAESMTTEELMQKLFTSVLGPEGDFSFDTDSPNSYAGQRANEARTKSIITNERASAELYYSSKNTYKGFCASTQFIKEPGVKCNDTDLGYSTYASLASGGYFCSDATGAAIATKAPPVGVICK